MLTLKELIDRCIEKDRSAWNEFILRFRALVEKSVRARFRRHNFRYTIEDVKDLVQTIFLEIWEHNKLESVKNEEKVTGWLAIVAQNATVDFMRSGLKFSRQYSLSARGLHGEAGAEEFLSVESDPLNELARGDLAAAIDTLIESLGPKEKLILKLNLQYNMTHKEIAGFMKISINSVSSVLRRTMLCFRESLRKRGYWQEWRR